MWGRSFFLSPYPPRVLVSLLSSPSHGHPSEEERGAGKREGLAREADEHVLAVSLQGSDVGQQLVVSRNRVENEVERFRGLGHRIRVRRQQEMGTAHRLGVSLLLGAGGNASDGGSHSLGVLDAHLAEATEADDGYGHAGLASMVNKGIVHGDACAQEWRCLVEGCLRRYLNAKVLVDNHLV
jgi:hypothetical protein